MPDTASLSAQDTQPADEIVRTEALTEADRLLIKEYQDTRDGLRDLVHRSAVLTELIQRSDAALPRALEAVTAALAIRLGYSSYQDLKAQGLDLSISNKSGTVSVVRAVAK